MTPESYERILYAEKDNFWAFQMGRVFTLMAAAGFLLLLQINGLTTVAVYPLYTLIASDVILTFPYWRYAVHTVETRNLARLRSLSLWILVYETVMMTVGSFLLGSDLEVYGLPIYGIIVVMGATLHSYRAGIGLSLLGGVMYAAMRFGISLDLLPPRLNPIAGELWPYVGVVSHAIGLFALGVVAAWLSHSKRQLEEHQEELIAERTQSLNNEKRFVEDSAAAAAHDLKSPLSRALTNLDYMASPEDAVDRDRMQDVAEDLDVSLSRVKGLLSLYVPDVDLSKDSSVDLREVLSAIADKYRSGADGGGLEIEIRSDLGFVRLAKPLVEQIFGLLIGNAIAHNQGRSSTRIEIGRSAERENEFYVRDDGIGVAEKDLERIFNAFLRIGREAHGTGLGLTLVRRRIEQIGGRVWAESPEGEGLTVKLVLPIDRERL